MKHRQFHEKLLNNLEEITQKFAEINPDEMLDNPPEEVKELISMVEE